MSDLGDIALEDIERVLEGVGTLPADLRSNESTNRPAVRCLKGKGAVMATSKGEAGHTRQGPTSAPITFEHRLRQSLLSVAAGCEEGLSIGLVGRARGFWRELACLHAPEERG